MQEKGKSIWKDTVKLPSFSTLNQNLETDVVIVGGGLCGILCAYQLRKKGLDVVIIEKNKIGMGITSNTTAVITAQHDKLYSERIKKDGFKKAKEYLEANLMALKEYQKLSEQYDFDFEEKSSYVYSLDNEELMKKEASALQELGFDAKFKETINLPFKIKGAVEFPKQAQMNALKLIENLVKGMEIYEHTEIVKISDNKVETKEYHINAKKIIIAAHFPPWDRFGLYYTKMYQNRSYVIAIKNNQELDGTYIDVKDGGLYFRSYQDYLLIGGNDKITGDKNKYYQNLISFAKEHYPNAKIEYEWANQDCVTLDEMPYIGRYSTFLKNVYVATGFNLWGMTSSMISAILLTDQILGKDNQYSWLFSPHRNMLKKQLWSNLGRYIKNLMSFGEKRCTHLGSSLVWNDEEQSWDCPCHGSRFEETGEIIDNPTMKKLK